MSSQCHDPTCSEPSSSKLSKAWRRARPSMTSAMEDVKCHEEVGLKWAQSNRPTLSNIWGWWRKITPKCHQFCGSSESSESSATLVRNLDLRLSFWLSVTPGVTGFDSRLHTIALARNSEKVNKQQPSSHNHQKHIQLQIQDPVPRHESQAVLCSLFRGRS